MASIGGKNLLFDIEFSSSADAGGAA